MKETNLVCVWFALMLIAGCASTPEPVEISEVEEVEATVVTVDQQDRFLVLRGPAGNEIGLYVGQEVRNLPQIKAGDRIRASYYTGLAVSIAEPGDAGADVEVAAGRAKEGARPGAMVAASTRATVEILSVAKDGTAVSFRDADGRMQSIDVQREKGQAFARNLKRGDLVDIRYTEAMAIAVVAADSGS